MEQNIFVNTASSRIIVGFVDSVAFNDDFASNPFRFHHYNIKTISISVNNNSMPIRPLTLDFESDECLLPCYLFFTSTEITGQDVSLSFGANEYNALFTFDIHQLTGNEALLHLEKSGSVKIEVQFGSVLEKSVHCVILYEQQGVLKIDKYRQAIVAA